MALVLHHHPHSRAASVVWMLEEVGVPYELVHVDIQSGVQKASTHLALNPMGKIPVLIDEGVIVTEVAAIGVYLADRYAPGRLAPALDDRDRGPYLKWCFFTPTVVEMGCMARSSGWTFNEGQAGFGTYERMIATLDEALVKGPWLLGERFTMADVILGATVLWMLQFKMIDDTAPIQAYANRLRLRAAKVAADARNLAVLG